MNIVARTTERPRPGRRFEPTHEAALQEFAVQLCSALPNAHRGLTVISELSGPTGIPDLTALVGEQEGLHDRINSNVDPLLNEIDAGVVAVAHPVVGRHLETLASMNGWPAETVRRRIPGLVRAGALASSGKDRYIRRPELVVPGRLYAIEAKVRDWRRALLQARGYRAWADSYVLVMGPLSPSTQAALAEEVRRDHAGLVVDGLWLARPRIQRLTRARRLWASEHLIAGLRSGHQPSVER